MSGGKKGKQKRMLSIRGAAGSQQADLERVAQYLTRRRSRNFSRPGCLAVIALDDTSFAAEAVTQPARST